MQQMEFPKFQCQTKTRTRHLGAHEERDGGNKRANHDEDVRWVFEVEVVGLLFEHYYKMTKNIHKFKSKSVLRLDKKKKKNAELHQKNKIQKANLGVENTCMRRDAAVFWKNTGNKMSRIAPKTWENREKKGARGMRINARTPPLESTNKQKNWTHWENVRGKLRKMRKTQKNRWR